MAVTAKDVAEACGVSRITVNRALSGNENVKPETREKILKKAQEMGYVPNLIARSLVNGKSKMIGIVISDIKNLYFSEIVDAITRQARARGYMVCTCTHLYGRLQKIKACYRLYFGFPYAVRTVQVI